MLEPHAGPAGGPPRMRLYISGDTVLHDGLDEITERFPAADLAVVRLGGTTLPGGFVVTMDGAQGAELGPPTGPPPCRSTTATTR
ncbi:hypothetical protein [Streptomyces sp. NPDC058735]|uniref:hypothetical protein n=1 Tax=unclassified Streptomyces TaxID=2593676 RepID=UPI0036BA07D6